jgi:tetratricopeptide (TPR) repeat protein
MMRETRVTLADAGFFSDNKDMSDLIPVLLALAFLALVGVLLFFIITRSKSGAGGRFGKSARGRDATFKEANKRLQANPRDPAALSTMGELSFQEGAWESAFGTYKTLLEILPSTQGLDAFTINLRYGLSAMKLNRSDAAYNGLSAAYALDANNFEVNLNLGTLEFQRKNYARAIQLLQRAKAEYPEHPGCLRILGHSFFKLKKYKEAMSFIRKAMELAPDDKESLFTLAECYQEANQLEQALKIFSHLRPDPQMGAQASLMAGTINMDTHREEKAVEDFQIGLKQQNISRDIEHEIKYKMAVCYLRMNEIGKALEYLHAIQAVNPAYRDVEILIKKYQEINANRNLHIYTMAPSAEFIALCRKIVMTYYPRARVKITNISVARNDWADILAEVDAPKWSDIVMFRFIRTQGSIGEMIVREFHNHLKEMKAGKGICFTVGKYTDEARRYTEARLIDLIEKEKIAAILNTLDAKLSAATKKK